MRKKISIFIGTALLCLSISIKAQTTLYFENFNSGGAAFTLNAADLGSDATVGGNRWVINANYTSFFGNTPTQPAGIVGNPTSTYMHIRSALTANATFLAPADVNKLTKMNAAVSTIGATNVTLSFWLLCNGDAIATDAYFGRTYYSIDGGSTWIQNPTTYVQIDTWTQVTVTNPIFDNQADLRFAFMWVQNSSNEFAAADPAFSIDDIKIEGITNVTNSITTGTITGSPFCAGSTFNVLFTSSGTFAGGNIYTAQLSSASGSFASPTNIGTLNSTANSGTIAVTIPAGATTGSGYIIRIISSNPVLTGSSSLAFSINAPITPTFSSIPNVCQNTAAPILPTSSTNSTPITGTWAPAVSTATAGTTVYTFTPTAGQCATTTTLSITVDPTIIPTFSSVPNVCQNTAAPILPTSSTNSTPITGTWAPAVSTATAGTTVYTFTPTAGQCATTTTLSITVDPTIIPTFSSVPNVCQNTAAPILPISSTNSTPITGTWDSPVSTATPGTTVYTFTPNVGQCATTTNLSITVDPTITPAFNGIGPLCLNAPPPVLPSNSTNASPIAGTWNPALINTSVAGTATYTFTPDANQCATITTIDIEITNSITPVFASIGPLCLGGAAPSLPSSSINSPSITGTWNPSTINTNTVGITTYTFTPNTGQCAGTTSIDIEITNSITPTFAAIGPFCQNTPTVLLPQSSSNLPSISGTWTPFISVNTTNVGTTTYTFTPDAGQCASITTVDIEINAPNTTPTFAQLGPICLNAIAPNLPTSSTNTTAITGSWNPSNINTAVAGITTYTFTPDAGQCATIASMDIEITTSIIPTFANIGPLCIGSAAPALPLSSTNLPSITGTWNPAIITTASIGTFTYNFTADPNQCAANASIAIDVSNSITPLFTSVAPICEGASAPILPSSSNNSPAITGTWSPASINTSLTGITVYTFTPDPGQCGATTTVDIEVIPSPPAPLISISASVTTICAGQSIDFVATPNSTNTGDIIQWFINGTAVTGGTGLLFSSNTLNNNDQITATFTPASSCLVGQIATSNLFLITVNPAVTPSISISSATTQICVGDNVTFNAIINGGGSTPQFQWFVNGNAVAGATANSFSTTTLSSSDAITVQLTSDLACAIPNTANSNSLSIIVLPYATPTIILSADRDVICVGQQVVLNSAIENGGAAPQFVWQIGANSFTTTSATYTVSGLNASTNVSCTLISDYACVASNTVLSNTIEIQVNQIPTVTLSEDVTIQEGETTELTASATAGMTYLWTPSASLSCSDCFTPIASPAETTVYTFIVRDTATSCNAIDSLIVSVIRNYDIWVPSAFSPNGDSNNDFFFVRGNNIKEFNISLYDRWGNKVYESSNLAEGWNGEFQNRVINSGILVYVLNFTLNDGISATQKGNITVSN